MTLHANVGVVGSLLARYVFASYQDLQVAQAELSNGVQLSMAHTEAYNIPMDQHLPDAVDRQSAAPFVHPHNIATALIAVCNAGPQLGFDQLALDPALQVFNPVSGQWQAVAGSSVPAVTVQVQRPVVPPPPPPPAPSPVPPPPPPAPVPAAPAPDLTSLVDAALGTPITSTDAYAQYRAEQGHATPGYNVIEGQATRVAPAIPVAPSSVPATPVIPAAPAPQFQTQPAPALPPDAAPAAPQPVTQHVTLEQARRESENAEAVGLPDASVLAERKGESGRPQKSPFERKVEPRTKVAPAPFWWPFLLHSSKRVFAENPAQALDPSSTGSGPIQAYALLVALLQEALRCADGTLTVAELRTYLREVETGMQSLESGAAIYQLVSHLFSADAKTE